MSEVKIPTNADEAVAMALVGMSWLEQHAPEKLTELHREVRATAGRVGFLVGVNWVFDTDCVELTIVNATNAAKQYAEQIRREGE